MLNNSKGKAGVFGWFLLAILLLLSIIPVLTVVESDTTLETEVEVETVENYIITDDWLAESIAYENVEETSNGNLRVTKNEDGFWRSPIINTSHVVGTPKDFTYRLSQFRNEAFFILRTFDYENGSYILTDENEYVVDGLTDVDVERNIRDDFQGSGDGLQVEWVFIDSNQAEGSRTTLNYFDLGYVDEPEIDGIGIDDNTFSVFVMLVWFGAVFLILTLSIIKN